jgi:hypothetical protein
VKGFFDISFLEREERQLKCRVRGKAVVRKDFGDSFEGPFRLTGFVSTQGKASDLRKSCQRSSLFEEELIAEV